MFRNRIEAGQLLAAKLKKYKDQPGIILAVPRGGVPVAYAVACQLGLPVQVILTKKIGQPANKEFAIGAASLNDHFIIPHAHVTEAYIQQELYNVRKKLREMHRIFIGDKDQEIIKDKIVIIIDDGIATGNTILATIHLLRKSEPAKIIIAVPVASASAVRSLSPEADEIVTVMAPEEFYGVGRFYEDFSEVKDEEVMFYLDKLRRAAKTA